MTSPVGSQHGAGAVHHHASKPQAPSDTFPGKSADSIGHLAKASVLETGDGEPNAQGKAASRIARMDLTVLSSGDSGDGQAADGAAPADQDAGDTDPAVPSA
ncbi:hypothetical protein DPM33_26815 [Mesorhizobium hawassense]|uniref:Uncharacterized protein n=1 Tax=Mesorhizobium hawassense TaxID=1209954 RepID=A0A330HE25_9HYPH|nr:hypothetical protein [Mesorhizobium hawassense]RAZ86961.1 hypothetical protein DPM33_26815 [Mesorhizobium hawassense]